MTNRQPPTTKSNVNVFKIQNALGVADQPKRERRVGGARLRGPVYTAVELKTTRSNAQEPVNIAYGLYVSTIPTAVFTNQNYNSNCLMTHYGPGSI